LIVSAALVAALVSCLILRVAHQPPAGGAGQGFFVAIADLPSLPEPLRATIACLLVLPAGVLVTSIIRNMIGFQTFGTLTPSLLAISFLQADAATSMIIFGLVIVSGLGGRALLGRLKLLMGPRLGLVLTFVVLCLAGVIAVMHQRGFNLHAGSILLPLVILTMIVERFYISIEENGPGASLALLASTVAVGAICLALLRWRWLGEMSLAYPEGELPVAAALILVGRYAGYRLTELWRFRALAANGRKEQKTDRP
jgi:hypothetical protein